MEPFSFNAFSNNSPNQAKKGFEYQQLFAYLPPTSWQPARWGGLPSYGSELKPLTTVVQMYRAKSLAVSVGTLFHSNGVELYYFLRAKTRVGEHKYTSLPYRGSIVPAGTRGGGGGGQTPSSQIERCSKRVRSIKSVPPEMCSRTGTCGSAVNDKGKTLQTGRHTGKAVFTDQYYCNTVLLFISRNEFLIYTPNNITAPYALSRFLCVYTPPWPVREHQTATTPAPPHVQTPGLRQAAQQRPAHHQPCCTSAPNRAVNTTNLTTAVVARTLISVASPSVVRKPSSIIG